jgi:CHAT domain-containing protein/tetratricopeptide (TPR) repeat protein
MTRTGRLLAATATVAITATGGLVVRDRPLWLRRALSDQPELVELVASRPPRSIDGRLTGGFDWAPKATPTRGGGTPAAPSPDVRIAIARTEQRLARERSPATLQAYAAGRLLTGDADAARRALEEAARRWPASAALQSDLAAAFLAIATQADRAFELPKALEAAERALAVNAGRAEAQFNKAIALERMHLLPQALGAWNRYLEIDAGTSWAVEARGHIESLRQASATQKPEDAQVLRERLVDDVLARWARAVQATDWRAAATALAEAEQVDETLRARSADLFAHDLVAAARRAMTERGTDAATLASGHAAFASARAHYLHDDFESSGPAFAGVYQSLHPRDNPLAIWAQVHLGIIQYRQNHLADAAQTFVSARRSLGDRRYDGVRGKIDQAQGLIAALQGDSQKAAAWYRLSAQEYGAAGEAENQAFGYGLLATNFAELGDPVRSWVARIQALSGTARESVLLRASFEALRSELPHAALVFAEASGALAAQYHRPPTQVDSLRWQAVIVSKLGDRARARALLAQARRVIGNRTGVAWDRLRAETDVATALAADDTDRGEGIEAASRALEYFEASHTLDRTPELYLARARLQQASGRTDAAQTDLERGLSVVATLRSHVARGPDQATLTDVLRGLVEQLADLHVGRQHVDEALIVAEAARGHDVVSGRETAAPQVANAREITVAIPRQTSILEFVVGERDTFVWLLQHDAMRFARVSVDRATLERLVDAARQESYRGASVKELRHLLLEKVDRFIGPSDALVVVADGPLHLLPFAALPGRQTPFLAQEHPLAYAVSATAWIRAQSAPARATGPPRSIVAAGAPLVNHDLYPDLPDLPYAGREATVVGRLYPDALTVLDADVTRDALVRALATSDVVHFAGHAIVNPLSASRSELVVFSTDGGGLTAADIRALPNVRARIVVLAACESNGGLLTQSEGPLGLARAFLAAGVPTVVASRWKLDDRASLAFFTAFHRAYSASGDAAAAVQAAQKQMITAPDSLLRDPAVWAGITVFGSGS